MAKALFFDDIRNGKTAFKAILIRGLHRADKRKGGALCRCVRMLARSMLVGASCSIALCVGDSVACVRHCLLLVGIGGKSGKRKRGRAGIFDFLFLNFFATKIQDFSSLPFLITSLYPLFLPLSALL